MKLNLFVHAKPAYSYETINVADGHCFILFSMEDMRDLGYTMVCPVSVEFEIPEGWDPRAQQLAALREKKDALRKEFADAVMKIDRQINSLLAIENVVEV